MTDRHAMLKQQGIIALISVLVITSIILIYGLSIALMNADEVLSSDALLAGDKSTDLTTACVENDLSRLRNNTSLTGEVDIAVGNVNCLSYINSNGNIRTINATATALSATGGTIVSRTNTNVNIATNPFTIAQYKDILN